MSTYLNYKPDYSDDEIIKMIKLKHIDNINIKGRDGRTLLIHPALFRLCLNETPNFFTH